MEALTFELRERFGWRVRSGFKERELQGLLQTGEEIAEAIERWLPGMDGGAWIRKNLGNAVFHKGGLPQKVVSWLNGGAKVSLVFLNHHVWLYPRLFNSYKPTRWVAHELGHVLENNLKWMSVWWGGGAGDDLLRILNTRPAGLRFFNTKVLQRNMPAELTWTVYNGGKSPNYGDHSSADYFAEVWTWSIYRPELIPPVARSWFVDWIRDQSLTMVD